MQIEPDKKRVKKILAALDKNYGTGAICYLDHKNAWQLLIAVILSAQCTDARVNTVTPELFARYKDAAALGSAKQAEVEAIIHPLGFYHSKAANIISCSRDITERFEGRIPDTLDELTSLSGVGRKTANVILGNIYGKPSVVVDTHVKRISRKLGFTDEEDPEKIEYALMKVLPKDHWILYNQHIITLGRTICKAQRPDCAGCFLREYCPSGKE